MAQEKDFYIATQRFGIGVSASQMQAISDPRGWLMEQVRAPQLSSPDFNGLKHSSHYANEIINMAMGKARKSNPERVKQIRNNHTQAFIREMDARLRHAVHSPVPFQERLVLFWSNHFTVSLGKPLLAGLFGPYEREAIRPHVTGNFLDMLVAVSKHPAMLAYLDNAQSTGPNSEFGRRKEKGLNENLAREILELHTLGVNGGYNQQDVTSFAKVITGWTINPGIVPGVKAGTFVFAENRHEPGPQTILGKVYAQGGEAQGLAVLRDLAIHPSTARHLATKLARHFVADEPPARAVETLERAYLQSGGDLKKVYAALVDLPEAWSGEHIKIKSNYDLIVSALRLCEDTPESEIPWCLQSLRYLGNIPFGAPSPAGYPDIARDIAGPDVLIRRVEWAQTASRRLGTRYDISGLSRIAVGPELHHALSGTLDDVRQPREKLAILLGSPMFQRR